MLIIKGSCLSDWPPIHMGHTTCVERLVRRDWYLSSSGQQVHAIRQVAATNAYLDQIQLIVTSKMVCWLPMFAFMSSNLHTVAAMKVQHGNGLIRHASVYSSHLFYQ